MLMISLRERAGALGFWAGILLAWATLSHFYYHEVLKLGSPPIAFSAYGRDVEILTPVFFGVLLALPLLWIVQKYTLSDLPRLQRWLNVVLRALMCCMLTGALVQVVLTSFESRVSTIFIVDTSASVTDEALAKTAEYINEAIEARGERDDVKLIAFAERPYEVPLARAEDGAIAAPAAIPRPPDEERLQSNPAAALRLAYGKFPQDHLKRVVIVSDGNATRGDLIAQAYRAEAFGIKIFNKEIEVAGRPEALIQGVDVPEQIKIGEPFAFVARVFSTHQVEVSLTLWQNDFKDNQRKVTLQKGLNEIRFDTQVYEPGFREFKLNMRVDGPDTFAQNNEFVYSANVRGKPRVLYIEGELRARHYLQRALRNENFEVETRGPLGLPRSLKELEGFDLLLVSDLPALNMSDSQMRLIERYVRELGGGFIMAGGESSFGPGGYYGAYIEKVLPVKFETKKKRETPTLALMLSIDRSGSMRTDDRIELAKDAAKATVDILKRNDKVGVSAFDNEVQSIVRMQSAANRVRISSDISRLRANGGTNIAAGLQDAYERLAVTPARLKHVILLSDGHSDPANIFSEILPAMRIENMTVSTVAVGAQSDTTLLRRIAEGGSGRYYYTADPYSVPRIFMKETSTVSRSSMVEEPFRARVVKQAQVLKGIPWSSSPYLLGYVSTKLKDEAELILQTEQGEPLLARWRYGLGKSVAFTSDLKNRWAVEWIRWPGYAKFWAQLIRDTMRSDDRDTLAMRTTVDQGAASIVVDAIDDEDRFINGMSSTVQVTAPKGKKSSVTLQQTAPGRYEASVALSEFGSYNLKARHDYNGDTIAVSLGSISYPYPQEYLFVEPNREILQRAADIGKGATNPDVSTLFDPMGEEVKYREELWPYFVMAAMFLLLLDLTFRRLRLGGKTELSWESVMGN
ncbi:MAG: VWA domain-containing protein [Myxococcota bacterium]